MLVMRPCCVLFDAPVRDRTLAWTRIWLHPLLYLSGVKAQNLQCILDYIYLGEVNVFQGQLDEFLESAYKLNIRGLATVQTEDTGVKEEIQEIDPPAYDVDVTEEETRQERMVMKAEMKSLESVKT